MAQFESFYPPKFFKKIYSRWVIIVLIAFWIVFVAYVLIAFSSWFWKLLWLLLAVYQTVGLAYMLLKRDELKVKRIPPSPAPEEFLRQVKKELRQSKKKVA